MFNKRNASRFRIAVIVFLLIISSLPSRSQDNLRASTPPMGWNSWDSYGRTINETSMKAAADVMAKRLKPFGWQYVVIDEGWYVLNPAANPKDYKFSLSADGRYVPDVERFPSSANHTGFGPLADYIHSLGLKFGIHVIRGIPREAVKNNLPITNSPFHAQDAADE